MIKYLSSMKFALQVIIAVILWLAVGVTMALNDTFFKQLKNLSEFVILDWLIKESLNSPGVLIWFAILCLLGFLLLLSFCFCSYNKLLKTKVLLNDSKRLLLFLAHLFFLAVLFFHVAGMFVGFKYSNIQMLSGDAFEFGNSYKLELKNISYVDDVKVLKMNKKESRKLMGRKNFNIQENIAEISLYNYNALILTDTARMLSPIANNSLRITLSGFYFDKEKKAVGASIVIMENPLVNYFFIIYGITILTLFVYVFTSWKKETNGEMSKVKSERSKPN